MTCKFLLKEIAFNTSIQKYFDDSFFLLQVMWKTSYVDGIMEKSVI